MKDAWVRFAVVVIVLAFAVTPLDAQEPETTPTTQTEQIAPEGVENWQQYEDLDSGFTPHTRGGLVVLLLDDSDSGRVDAIIEILRMKLKPYQLRLYQSKTGEGGWKTAQIRKMALT